MTDAALLALAARVERATGPDRELDEAITLIVHPWLADIPRTPEGGWLHPRFGKIRPAAAYTESLDAVMTLVPEGWFIYGLGENVKPIRFVGDTHANDGGFWAEVQHRLGGRLKKAKGATPALALLAAILRAMAAMEEV